jgi:K+ transporter
MALYHRIIYAVPWDYLLLLGGVFLCVTGAEALYADMGHFGAKPIRLAWSALGFPNIVLNDAGQAGRLNHLPDFLALACRNDLRISEQNKSA